MEKTILTQTELAAINNTGVFGAKPRNKWDRHSRLVLRIARLKIRINELIDEANKFRRNLPFDPEECRAEWHDGEENIPQRTRENFLDEESWEAWKRWLALYPLTGEHRDLYNEHVRMCLDIKIAGNGLKTLQAKLAEIEG